MIRLNPTFCALLLSCFIIVVLTLPSSDARNVRSHFGEPCNKTLRCKSHSYLSCDHENTNKCQCVKPNQMIYDTVREKCVSLIGEKCKTGLEEDEPECVEGAICTPDEGICYCPPKHYEDSESKKCLNVKGYEDNCSTNSECDGDQMLTCIENTCQCFNPNYMNFDNGEKLCKVKVGKNCNFFSSQISEARFMLKTLKCVNGSSCDFVTGICSCPVGQYENLLMNICSSVKSIGESCENKSDCDSNKMLSCIDGVCQCDTEIAIRNRFKFYSTTWLHYFRDYEDETKLVDLDRCVAKVGKPCNLVQLKFQDTEIKFCLKNAECISSDYYGGNGTCKCSKGYSETHDFQCGLGFGKSCSTERCGDKFMCTNNRLTNNGQNAMRCLCPNQNYQVYDSTTETCRGLVGKSCDPNSNFSCVNNSECIKVDGRFRCECAEGFVENVEKRCDIEFGSSCHESVQNTGEWEVECDQLAELQCKGKWRNNITEFTCSCPDDSDVYEGERRRCSRAVGVGCDEDLQCVSKAICDRLKKLQGRCHCADGFTTTESFTCEAAPYFLARNDNKIQPKNETSVSDKFEHDFLDLGGEHPYGGPRQQIFNENEIIE